MELISKISKGSKMDQIYIPKNRAGFNIGSYVLIKPLHDAAQAETAIEKHFFYNIKNLEPVKIAIISEIFHELEKKIDIYENIIFTGSFLDAGFNFNDIDILIVKEKSIDNTQKNIISRNIEKNIGITLHLIILDHKALLKGLSTDPLYQSMLSRCVSKKRFVYNVKREINYKLLDLHLLKSKLLIENFDMLSSREKYEQVRNAVSISLFIKGRKLGKEEIDNEINRIFGPQMNIKIKENLCIEKSDFLRKYRNFYNKLFSSIMDGIKNASKQKPAH